MAIIRKFMTYEELMARWSMSAKELAELRLEICPLILQEKRTDPDTGESTYHCIEEPGDPVYDEYYGRDRYVKIPLIYDIDEVEKYEQEHPHLSHTRETFEEIDIVSESLASRTSRAHSKSVVNSSDIFRCSDLSDRWGVSPFTVYDYLGNEDGALRYFSMCDNDYVYGIDLIEWEKKNKSKINCLNEIDVDSRSIIAENVALRQQLEAERAKAVRPGEPEHLERGKEEKTAERWKNHLRTCLILALHVKAAGREFTTDALRKACSELGLPALGEEALEIFRKTMPPECINTGGRPPKK